MRSRTHPARCRFVRAHPSPRPRRHLYRLLPILSLSLSPTLAFSQTSQPLVTDRPDFTESAVTVAPGRVQLEGGYSFTREGELEVSTIGELLVRIGVHERVEARIGLNSFRIAQAGSMSEEGLEDLAVGAKVKISEGAASFEPLSPGIAILIGAGFPTGAEAFQADGVSAEATVSLAWPLSERLGLGSNLSVGSEEAGDDRFFQYSGSVALGVSLARSVGGYLEVFGFASDDDAGTEAGFVNGGITYLVNDDFQLDLRVGVSPSDPQPNYFAGMGAAYRIGR